jgi:hypothetical protein
MSAYLIKQKFYYFLKYKKLYLLRISLILSVFLGSMFFGGKYILEHNTFFQVQRIVTKIEKDTIYVPDTIHLNTYIKNLSKSLSMDSTKLVNRVYFAVYYTQDTSKNAEKFLKMMAELESRQTQHAVNGDHWGLWQNSANIRKQFGYGGVSKEDYLNSKAIQRENTIKYLKDNYLVLRPYLNKYNNKIIRGYHLTLSGMIAMAHNCGPGGLRSFLNSNCVNVPHDGNIASTNYLTLGNYDIKELLEEDLVDK